MTNVIGIDLGTTNSCLAVMEAGEAKIVTNSEGGRTTPSVVHISKEGERIVGVAAKRQLITHPDRTVASIKRKMGSNFKVTIDGRDYTPQEISAMILSKIKRDAESYLGEPVTQAVITVPAYFEDAQKRATRDAGKIAGLEVLRIINEPTAAALAYGLDKAEKEQTVMVYDLGGGTFDVSILEIGEGVFEVKATSGNNHLGGDDFDQRIAEWLADNFQREQGIDLRDDTRAMQRLREAAEKAKIELSTTLSSDINLPFLSSSSKGPLHFNHALTRAKLEEIVRPIVERCRQPVKTALSDAKLTPAQIDKIILVGGPTRMPIVQTFVEELVGKKVERGVDPMECVAMGAAVQAGVLAGEVKDILLLDVTPLSLGIETLGGIMTRLIERNTTIPTRKSQIFSTAADFQTSVDVHVLQGERPMASDNVELGKFALVGIPPAPRGVPQIEVSFDIDANGILHVSAKDLGTGKEQKMRITAPLKMSKEEIAQKMKEAEQYAEEDKKKREEAELKNEAEALVYTSEKTLSELKDKLSKEQTEKVEKAVNEVKEVLSSGDASKIKSRSEELKRVLQEAGSYVYQQAAAAKGAAEGEAGERKEAGQSKDSVDVPFEKVDDEKKGKRSKN